MITRQPDLTSSWISISRNTFNSRETIILQRKKITRKCHPFRVRYSKCQIPFVELANCKFVSAWHCVSVGIHNSSIAGWCNRARQGREATDFVRTANNILSHTSLIQNNVTPADGLRQITSVQPKLAKWSVPGQGIGPMWRNRFLTFSLKCEKSRPEKGSLNRLFPLVNYINSDPLSDHSKSKAQITKVQQPCHTLQIPLRKNQLSREEKEEDISFSSLPDGKSASRKNITRLYSRKNGSNLS